MNAVQAEVNFLLQRMEELDFSQSAEAIYRDFCGHVWPSAERLKALVADPVMERCPRCHGTGEWRQGICRYCGGKGLLPSEPIAKIDFVRGAA